MTCDTKKLAITPLTDFEPGTNDMCLAIMAHLDNGESATDIGVLLSQHPITIGRWGEKGRAIRDRLIKEWSAQMIKAVQDGEVPAPRVQRGTRPVYKIEPNGEPVPGVTTATAKVTFMSPPRGIMSARPEPMH